VTELGFVHRFVPATEPDNPVALLLLHGTGGNEQDLLPLGQTLLPGAALLSPRGKVLENGMPRFFRRFAEGVFDIEDLKHRADELSTFIDQARERYSLMDKKFIAVGYSNGANVAAGLILRRPDQLSGACLLRAMVPYEPDLSNLTIFLSAGQGDPIAPAANTNQLARILQSGALR
jgi:predicted esterase